MLSDEVIVAEVWVRASRLLHTYLSMISFSSLLFFAVTGITLNHQGALSGEPKASWFSGQLDGSWLNPPSGREVARDQIIAALRKAHGIKAAVKDFRVEDSKISVSFKGPGYAADLGVVGPGSLYGHAGEPADVDRCPRLSGASVGIVPRMWENAGVSIELTHQPRT